MPYLMHLSKETEETVNLTVREGAEIIFVSRFLSRHVLNTDVIIGTRMPAYATAPGIAMLSRLPEDEAMAVIDASDLRAHTPSTTWQRDALLEKLRQSAAQGYATAFEEVYIGDARSRRRSSTTGVAGGGGQHRDLDLALQSRRGRVAVLGPSWSPRRTPSPASRAGRPRP